MLGLFAELGVNVNNGLGDIYDKIKGHPMEEEVKADTLVNKIVRIEDLQSKISTKAYFGHYRAAKFVK